MTALSCLRVLPALAGVLAPLSAVAQAGSVPADASGADEGVSADAEPAPVEEPGGRLFPLGGRAAVARGYRIPEPWGIGALVVWNRNAFNTADLAAAVAKGEDPPDDGALVPLPAVTTSRLEGDTRMTAVRADLWLFPGVNLFAALGEVRGTNQIEVAIDADALIPFPFCRPAKPCGTVTLPIETRVRNTTVTTGIILVYGTQSWFILGSAAHTLSISSKQRSDVSATNLALRGGPRVQIGPDTFLEPYAGVNYFDLNTRVRGIVRSAPFFADGDSLHLRYDAELTAKHPFAGVVGLNVELSRNLTLQGEVQIGENTSRSLVTAGVRF